MKIAIIGTGIAGNSASWLLNKSHDITVYEQNDYVGGHSNTASISGHPSIDTGFIVYNEWTYPNLIALFNHLNVGVEKTDMSFGVSLDQGRTEYSGDYLFAQKKNIFNLPFLMMVRDILRFYKQAPDYLKSNEPDLSLGDFLKKYHYSQGFIDYHILPMAAAIWSTSAEDVRQFPARSFIRFFKNHGLLLLKNRPQWWTVKGGSRNYVQKLTESFQDKIKTGSKVVSIERQENGVLVTDQNGHAELYDQAVLSCHSDQALHMLKDASEEERAVLSAFPYAPNKAYLHQDESLMPKNKKTWSSWNYLTTTKDGRVVLTYWMNKLQPSIGQDQNYFVTLNPETRPQNILYETDYDHPQYRMSALQGWEKIKVVQGKNKIWFCGAWCGYGFHEDGLSSGLAVAESIGPDKRPWGISEEKSPAGTHSKSA